MKAFLGRLIRYLISPKIDTPIDSPAPLTGEKTKIEWVTGNAVDVIKDTMSKPRFNRPLDFENDKVVLEWKMSKALNYFIWKYFLLFREDRLTDVKPEQRDSTLVELTEAFSDLYNRSKQSGHPDNTSVRFFYNTDAKTATAIFIMLGMIFSQHLPKLQHEELKIFLAEFYDNLLVEEES
jgi:hypothetical protein